MKQFDIYDNPSPRQRDAAPYIVVLSSHLIIGLSEIVVAPVVLAGLMEPNALDVGVRVGEQSFVVSVIGMAALRETDLKRRVASLADYEYEIRRALDRLFTGF